MPITTSPEQMYQNTAMPGLQVAQLLQNQGMQMLNLSEVQRKNALEAKRFQNAVTELQNNQKFREDSARLQRLQFEVEAGNANAALLKEKADTELRLANIAFDVGGSNGVSPSAAFSLGARSGVPIEAMEKSAKEGGSPIKEEVASMATNLQNTEALVSGNNEFFGLGPEGKDRPWGAKIEWRKSEISEARKRFNATNVQLRSLQDQKAETTDPGRLESLNSQIKMLEGHKQALEATILSRDPQFVRNRLTDFRQKELGIASDPQRGFGQAFSETASNAANAIFPGAGIGSKIGRIALSPYAGLAGIGVGAIQAGKNFMDWLGNDEYGYTGPSVAMPGERKESIPTALRQQRKGRLKGLGLEESGKKPDNRMPAFMRESLRQKPLPQEAEGGIRSGEMLRYLEGKPDSTGQKAYLEKQLQILKEQEEANKRFMEELRKPTPASTPYIR